jgi:hypothetical protein
MRLPTSLRVGFFLATRQLRRSNPWSTSLIVFVMILTFLNLVVVSGISRYDLLILGPNEEFPDKVLDSTIKFKLDSVLVINGLDFWRIYAKEN